MYVSQHKSSYPNQLIQRTKSTTINHFPITNFTSAKINIDTTNNLPVSLLPQQATFQLANRAFPRTNISWIQRCRYKTPIFYINIFPYCLYPILNPNLPFFTPLPNPPQRNLRIRPTKNIFFRNLFLHCQLHRYQLVYSTTNKP